MLRSQVSDARDDLKVRQSTQKVYYDRGSKELAPLHEGDRVLVRTDKEKTWDPPVVVQEHANLRSYVLDNGQSCVRRNIEQKYLT